MHCHECGAETISDEQAFCQICGAPLVTGATVSRAGATPAVQAPETPVGPQRLRQDFTGGALALFGWTIFVAIGMLFIIPAPFVLVEFARWFLGKCRFEDGSSYRFHGAAGGVWILTTLYGVVQIVNILASAKSEEIPALGLAPLVIVPINLILGWFFLRWAAGSSEALGRRLRFEGSIWGYLGWTLLIYVSVLTIIGWAWALAGYSDWLGRNSRGSGLHYEFCGRGHEILWRTLVYALGILLIVTAPWSIKWYMRWYIQQFEAVVNPPSEPARAL
ncbi:MAG: hypothetical protein GC160_25680 [Acidobacteria bacterium]|nr:hypothetical protein [Acidobacteriota bacterium]